VLTPARYVHRKRRESLKTLAWGLVWTVGAMWFVFSSLGNPINDLRLMLYGKTIAAEVTDSFEDVTDGDDGQSHWSSAIAYRFRTPDGRIVEGVSKGSGRLPADLVDLKAPVPVDVEYHPNTPSLNRFKGDGSHTLGGWLLRTIGFGLFLSMLCWPGVNLLRDGLVQYRHAARELSAGAAEADVDLLE
jgi:hypothetical protein